MAVYMCSVCDTTYDEAKTGKRWVELFYRQELRGALGAFRLIYENLNPQYILESFNWRR
jgi:hypothetical protein